MHWHPHTHTHTYAWGCMNAFEPSLLYAHAHRFAAFMLTAVPDNNSFRGTHMRIFSATTRPGTSAVAVRYAYQADRCVCLCVFVCLHVITQFLCAAAHRRFCFARAMQLICLMGAHSLCSSDPTTMGGNASIFAHFASKKLSSLFARIVAGERVHRRYFGCTVGSHDCAYRLHTENVHAILLAARRK